MDKPYKWIATGLILGQAAIDLAPQTGHWRQLLFAAGVAVYVLAAGCYAFKVSTDE